MVDARGLLCPMPVVMVQKAVKDGHPAEIEVLLDDACAVENVTRYANRQGLHRHLRAGGLRHPPDAEEMTAYIATFHTHLSALLTCRALTAAGVAAQMMPVPRRLSAACGTCVRYTADSPMLSCMDTDYEAVYETADNAVPRLLCENR